MKRPNTFSDDSQSENRMYPVSATKRLRHGRAPGFELKSDRVLAIRSSNTQESLDPSPLPGSLGISICNPAITASSATSKYNNF